MSEGQRPPQWRVIGKSVTGATHLRANGSNQDAIAWWPTCGEGPRLVLAVADGHGSAKYFRSDVGAACAVRTATWAAWDFLDGRTDLSNWSAVKRYAAEWLPQELVRRWNEAVAEHAAGHPLSPEELAELEHKEGTAARQAVESHPGLAYGATVLTVAVTESFILYLQLGDGDILTVTAIGEVERPLPRDERLLGNETTSLSSLEAWKDVRVRFQALSGPPPTLILAATDGYANSFRDEEAFLEVGTDLLHTIRSNELDVVNDSLARWLAETSQEGSGDDITLGIMCRMDAFDAPAECTPAELPRIEQDEVVREAAPEAVESPSTP